MTIRSYHFLLIFFSLNCLKGMERENEQWLEHVLTDEIKFTSTDKPILEHYLIESFTGMSIGVKPKEASSGKQVMGDSDNGLYKKVSDTTHYPYCSIGYIEVRFDGEGISEHASTGCLIGPQHVLTAAHNVYSEFKHVRTGVITQQWARQFRINCDLNNFKDCEDTYEKDWTRGVRIYLPAAYIENINNIKEYKKFDLAVVVLEKPIGLKIGWFGCLFSRDNNLFSAKKITITGYPSNKGEDEERGNQMWSMSDFAKQADEDRIYYDIITAPSQSGSPVWLNIIGSGSKRYPMVVGVHTTPELVEQGGWFTNSTTTPRSGTRITEQKFRQIMHIITQTLEFVCPIPPRITAQQLKALANELPQPEAELRLVDGSSKALKKSESLRCPAKSAPKLTDFNEQNNSSSSDDSETSMAQYEFEQEDSSSSEPSDEVMAQYEW